MKLTDEQINALRNWRDRWELDGRTGWLEYPIALGRVPLRKGH